MTVFFVHVMKTGGTNLLAAARQGLTDEQVFPNPAVDFRFVDGKLDAAHHLSIDYLRSLSEERRRTIRLYAAHHPYTAAEVVGSPRTIAVLRDPIDRTLSLLRQIGKRGAWTDRTDNFPQATWPLERLYEDPDTFRPLILNHQTKIMSMPPTFFRDDVPADLATACANLERLDVLGLTERYDELRADVHSAFGWVVPAESHANRTSDDRPVPASLRRRIAEDNPLDMALYDFAKSAAPGRRGDDRLHPAADTRSRGRDRPHT